MYKLIVPRSEAARIKGGSEWQGDMMKIKINDKKKKIE